MNNHDKMPKNKKANRTSDVLGSTVRGDVDRSGAVHEAVSEAASAASHAVGQGGGSTRKRLDSERRLSDVLIVVS